MSRQLRTLQQGESRQQFPAASSGLTVVNLPAAGYSLLTRGADYVLGAPAAGVMKRLICVSSASAAITVYGSTNGAATVTFDNNGKTALSFPVSTIDQAVELIGINSTRWSILNVHPYTTAATSPCTTSS